MKLSQALKEKLYDVRLRDKLVAEGKLSKTELEKYQKSLDESSNNMIFIADLEQAKKEHNAKN